MHIVPILLLAAAIACWGFFYWGLYTLEGRHAFDEMAGIIPFAAAPIGVILALLAAMVWWSGRRKRVGRNR